MFDLGNTAQKTISQQYVLHEVGLLEPSFGLHGHSTSQEFVDVAKLRWKFIFKYLVSGHFIWKEKHA